VRVAIRLSPGSKATRVGGRYGDTDPPVLVVRVTAPAVEGRANDAAVRALARAFAVPLADVRIVSGHSARTKLVEIEGGEVADLRNLLDA